MLPKLNGLNNAITTAKNGSPMKAGVSDGTSSFSRGKMLYTNAVHSNNNVPIASKNISVVVMLLLLLSAENIKHSVNP